MLARLDVSDRHMGDALPKAVCFGGERNLPCCSHPANPLNARPRLARPLHERLPAQHSVCGSDCGCRCFCRRTGNYLYPVLDECLQANCPVTCTLKIP